MWHHLIEMILLLLLLPAIHVTAFLLTAIFAMPIMLNHVAEKYYPGLGRRHGLIFGHYG